MRLVIIVLLSLLTLSTLQASNDMSINKLEPNENIAIEFTSSGCFHHFASFYVFGKDIVSIFEIKTMGDDRGMRELGSLQLSNDDIQGLDQLLHYYSEEKVDQQRTTTHEKTQIELSRDGQILRKIVSYNSSDYTQQIKGIVTLSDLMKRIKQKNE